MPRLLGLMESGAIEGYSAGRVTDVAAALDAPSAREVDEQLAAKLESGRVGLSDPVGVVRAARRLVEKIGPLTMNDSGCELSGYGPIPAPIAREIMTNMNSAWRKVLTDPVTAAPQSLGRHRRRPNALIRDLVAVRDRECSMPGCHRPVQRADFDHVKEWADGGDTGVDNGAATCERDHYRKGAPGWC